MSTNINPYHYFVYGMQSVSCMEKTPLKILKPAYSKGVCWFSDNNFRTKPKTFL